MKYLVAAYTESGKRPMNQDAYCVRKASTSFGEILMAVLCDGMGGADLGERASEETTQAFSCWFREVLPGLLGSMDGVFQRDLILQSWTTLLKQENEKLIREGNRFQKTMGTTTSVLLLVDGEACLIHVGDSRIYHMSRKNIVQMSVDHSVVGQEVREGKITEEQARRDPRRNQLMQCVGIRGEIHPQCAGWTYRKGDRFLLTSDGFVHENTPEEICRLTDGWSSRQETGMEKKLEKLTCKAMEAGESDNITSVLIRVR